MDHASAAPPDGAGIAEVRCGPGVLRLRRFFLGRLARLADLRAAGRGAAYAQPPPLVRRALVSTYRDCLRLGVRSGARRILGLPDV